MRNIAIINTHDEVDILHNIILKIDKNDNIFVFKTKNINIQYPEIIKVIDIPEDKEDSDTKIKNFISKYFFDNSFNGFLHVIEDSIEIYNDPTTFLSEIEKMMSKLHLKSWFNTVTDVCNYSFNIYNPRFSVDLDEPTIKEVYDKTIYWTSHANTSWVCYDYSIATFDDVSFNESFTIAMFYIITFLAERRNHKKDGELYYMNFYPSIKDELGVFRLLQNVKDKPSSDVEYSKQNEIFRNMNVNYTADMSIEKVMDDIFDILTKK